MSVESQLRKFDMETEVRVIVADILKPISDRTNQNYQQLRDHQNMMQTISKRMEEIDKFVKVDLNLKQFLHDIKKKQNSLQDDFMMSSTQHTMSIDNLKATIAIINDKYQSFLKEKVIFQSEREVIVGQIKMLEVNIQHHHEAVMKDLTNHKNTLNYTIEDLQNDISKMQIENSTTRQLVKKQMEEFATIYSMLEINKMSISRLEKKVDTLPVFDDLAETDEYLNKYLPFKVQNMIDDTLFSVLGTFEMQKLLTYEQQAFQKLQSNLRTLESKLFKQEHYVPSDDERQRLLKLRNIEQLKAATSTLAVSGSHPNGNPRVNSAMRLRKGHHENSNVGADEDRKSDDSNDGRASILSGSNTLRISSQHLLKDGQQVHLSRPPANQPPPGGKLIKKVTGDQPTNAYGQKSMPKVDNVKFAQAPTSTEQTKATQQQQQQVAPKTQQSFSAKSPTQPPQRSTVAGGGPSLQPPRGVRQQPPGSTAPQMRVGGKIRRPVDPRDPSKGYVEVDYDEDIDDQFLTAAQRKHKKLMKMKAKKTIDMNVDGEKRKREEGGEEGEEDEDQDDEYYDEEDEGEDGQNYYNAYGEETQSNRGVQIHLRENTGGLIDPEDSQEQAYFNQNTDDVDYDAISPDDEQQQQDDPSIENVDPTPTKKTSSQNVAAEVEAPALMTKKKRDPAQKTVIQKFQYQHDDTDEPTVDIEKHLQDMMQQSQDTTRKLVRQATPPRGPIVEDYGKYESPPPLNDPVVVPPRPPTQIVREQQQQEVLPPPPTIKGPGPILAQATLKKRRPSAARRKEEEEEEEEEIEEEGKVVKRKKKRTVIKVEQVEDDEEVVGEKPVEEEEEVVVVKKHKKKRKVVVEEGESDKTDDLDQYEERSQSSQRSSPQKKPEPTKRPPSALKPDLLSVKSALEASSSKKVLLDVVDPSKSQSSYQPDLNLAFRQQSEANDKMKNELEDMYRALQQAQQHAGPPAVLQEEAQFAMDNPQAFMLESLSMIKELQIQLKNLNDRSEVMRKEVALHRKEAIDESNQLIYNFTHKMTAETQRVDEQMEDVRGEINETIKQRKRERADLMLEMSNVVQRIDKGKEQYESSNQTLNVIIREVQSIIKVLKITQQLDSQDEVDRESIFLMGLKDTNLASNAGGDFESPIKNVTSTRDMLHSRRSSASRININNINPNTGLPGHQVVSLDKNCLTCGSGGIPFAMNAFKIACLQYTPSVVAFEQGTLTRKQLIDIKGQILGLCEDNVNSYDTNALDQGMRKVMFYVNSQHAHTSMSKRNILSPLKSGSQFNTPQASVRFNQTSTAGFDMSSVLNTGTVDVTSPIKRELVAFSKMKLRQQRNVAVSTVVENGASFTNTLETIRSTNSSTRGPRGVSFQEAGNLTDRYRPIPIEPDNPLHSLNVHIEARGEPQKDQQSYFSGVGSNRYMMSHTASNFNNSRKDIFSPQSSTQVLINPSELKNSMEGKRVKIFQRHHMSNAQ